MFFSSSSESSILKWASACTHGIWRAKRAHCTLNLECIAPCQHLNRYAYMRFINYRRCRLITFILWMNKRYVCVVDHFDYHKCHHRQHYRIIVGILFFVFLWNQNSFVPMQTKIIWVITQFYNDANFLFQVQFKQQWQRLEGTTYHPACVSLILCFRAFPWQSTIETTMVDTRHNIAEKLTTTRT